MLLYFFHIIFATAFPLYSLLIFNAPINLDLLDSDNETLHQQEAQFVAKLHSPSFHKQSVIDLDKQEVDYSQFSKYQLTKRSSFSPAKLQYLVQNNPKFVLIFKDTPTYIVPVDLAAEKGSSQYEYVEYQFNKMERDYDNVLIPATGCLMFSSNEGEGFVGIRNKLEVAVSTKLDSSFTLSLAMAVGFSSSQSVASSGAVAITHQCSTKGGYATRLFYKFNTVVVQANRKVITFNVAKSSMKETTWVSGEDQKYLTDNSPIYLCATADKMDLQCDNHEVDTTDNDGFQIKSRITKVN